MEQRPKSEQPRESHKIGAMLCRMVDEHLPMRTIDDVEMPMVLLVNRQKAYSMGIGPHGEIPEEIKDSQLDELWSDAINPSLN